jgi:hypothetical protein
LQREETAVEKEREDVDKARAYLVRALTDSGMKPLRAEEVRRAVEDMICTIIRFDRKFHEKEF